MSNQTAGPSPALLFSTINAYQHTAAIKAAIELDLFTAIGAGAETVQELAEKCQGSERALRILCDNLVILGFLSKTEQCYNLTPDSALFLDRHSPAYMGDVIEFMLSPMLTDGFKDLTAVVRSGGEVLSEGTTAPEHPVWVTFARAMAPMMRLPAQLMVQFVDLEPGRKWKVLDIAAGHGLFGIALAEGHPDVEVVAQDWPNVLEVAQENARAAGLAGLYNTLPGSAFEVDYGGGYDLVILANFLHHFDIATCEQLLKKVHTTLTEGGRALTVEFVPNVDRVSPPDAASFSLMMLGTTPHGDAYTFAEYESMFRNAGFSRSEIHALPPSIHQLVISYK